MPFYINSPVPLTFQLTDAGGDPVTATTIPVCTVTLPDQTTTAPTVTLTGTLYTAPGPSTQAGHYTVAWSCTDTKYPGGLTDSYDVRALAETSILSLAQCKRALRIDPSDTSEDDFVTDFARSVTDIVEWWCGPVNVQTRVEELRVGGLTVVLSRPPVMQLLPWTSVPPQFAADTNRTVPVPASPMFPVMVFGVTYGMAQLYADPRKGAVHHTSGLPFYYGPYLWQYQSGRPVVPECIRSGFRAILRHIYGMERGGQQASGALGAGDEETTLTPMGYAVPNRALELMAPEQLGGGAAIA